MRFLCITQNQGSGNTELSQPGLQKRRGEAPKVSVFRSLADALFRFLFLAGNFSYFSVVNPSRKQGLK